MQAKQSKKYRSSLNRIGLNRIGLNRIGLGLTALLLTASFAQVHAQQLSTSLPLTSVGDKLLWSVGDQTLTLTVTESGPLKLDLYSPQLDKADYRSDSYYGDETYDAGPVGTRFDLLDASGVTVATRSYLPGKGTWDTFFDADLAAGSYKLRASTGGNGKNTFALRLSGTTAALSAERLAVNVHSQVFVPVLNVTTDGAGYELQMYDGDGSSELVAQLRDASGKVTPLEVSAQRGNVSLKLPDAAGRYTVELRQPVGARQYSNTVGFSLARNQASRPITLTTADALGTLRVEAELILPTGTTPTTLPVQVGSESIASEPFSAQRRAGTYPVSVPQVPGAATTFPAEVTVRKNETALVRVQVKPRVTVSIEADRQQVCVGDVVLLTARATTEYQGELPLELLLSSAGLKLAGNPIQKGTLSASKPGELTLEAAATQAGDFSVLARLAPWADARAINIQVLPDATGLQLRRTPLAEAKPGDTVQVKLNLTNTTAQPQDYALQDTPGEGLEAQGDTTFTGTLKPGESRDLSYAARVTATSSTETGFEASLTGGSLDGVPCGVAQTAQGRLTVRAPAPVVQAPIISRQSTVVLPYEAPAPARTLIVSQGFPAGGTYVPGSSKLNGQPIPDPVQGASGTVYWTIPAQSAASIRAAHATHNDQFKQLQQTGVVSYELSHSGELPALPKPSLIANYDRERQEVLLGRFDARDYAGARQLGAAQAAAPTENQGAIKLPIAGTVFRDRDRITVTVSGPLDTVLAPTINGQPLPEKQIGSRTTDTASNTQRLEYVGVPIVPGRNVISLGTETQTVYLAGPTASVSFTPINLIADGSTPVRFRVLALDAAGQPSAERYLSLASSLEPRTPDASTSDAGYQIALNDGAGELVLQPQSVPAQLDLKVSVGGKLQPSRYQVVPDDGQVGVGVVSATLGFPAGGPLFSLQARAYYEGPLLGGKLYLAADKDGLPTTQNPYLRYPTYGDNSIQTVPLEGIDPVAINYDHPLFHAQYRQGALPITVFASVGDNLTALSGSSKSNPSVAGFMAAVPGDLKTETLVPNGTRLLRLAQGDVVQDSESLQLVASRNGQETGRSVLTRYVDYTLDPSTGVITLSRGLERLADTLDELAVVASYRLADPLANRTLGFGAEARYQGQNFSVGAAVIGLDDKVTSGVRAAYDDGRVRGGVLAAYSGGVQLSADLSAVFGNTSASAQARYQGTGYAGVGTFSAGTNIRANLSTRFSTRLGAALDAEYHNLPSGQGQIGQSRTVDGQAGTIIDTQGGSASARFDYSFLPFSVGAGVRSAFGDVNGLGVLGSVGYHLAGFDIDLTHTQPLTGNLKPVTEFASKVAIGKVYLGFRDQLTWGGDNVAALSLGTTLGNTNYAVTYELPTASGAGNRARFGVDTSLTLGKQFTLGLRGAVLRDLAKNSDEASAGADLRFHSDVLSASLGGDVALRDGKFGTVLRGGVSGSLSRNLTLTADGTLDLTPGTPGSRASLGYAYRYGAWNSLGYLRYLNGSLSGGAPEISTGAAAEYHQPRYALRAGLDTRTLLNDTASFTYQPSVSGTYYFTDSLGVGAWGRALIQPSTGSSQIGYGLEGSVRALPGTWLSAGYNFAGFDGLSTSSGAYTRPGFYLRLDLTIDELLGNQGDK